MNGIVRKFHALLERYRFREPVPDNVQDYILRYKRQAAVNTLKHFADYGIVYGLVMRVFFGVRRAGIRLSIVQSKMAVFLAAMIVLFIIGLIAVLYLKPAIDIAPPKKAVVVPETLPDNAVHPTDFRNNVIEEKDKTLPDKKNEVIKPGVRFGLGVETFTSEALDRSEAGRISSLITGEIVRLKGKGAAVRLGAKYQRKNAKMVMLGGVEKLGDTYIITAKIVDVERGSVIASFDDSADSYEGINAACARIAGKAAGAVTLK
ncbi:MAG TPA: hypothetical protein PK200_17325 [Spirochaetota bacterium]|nr:hypothetical protein [Spirochaetota bacterium]